MENKELLMQQCQEFLEKLDKAIAEGPWEDTNFLKAVGHKLKKIRDDFVRDAGLDDNNQTSENDEKTANALNQDIMEVYISLYSSEGANLQSWERIINNLMQRNISRPIYLQEQDIINIIKTKENPVNEAYIAIHILKSDVLTIPKEKIPIDKRGVELLTLKDKAIQLDKINKFVNQERNYRYVKSQLIKY
jgi:intracellular multiplication protein IcmQ